MAFAKLTELECRAVGAIGPSAVSDRTDQSQAGDHPLSHKEAFIVFGEVGTVIKILGDDELS